MWNGPFVYGSAAVTKSRRRPDEAAEIADIGENLARGRGNKDSNKRPLPRISKVAVFR
jgi:hypothetical protein